jgi:hypothetical protein
VTPENKYDSDMAVPPFQAWGVIFGAFWQLCRSHLLKLYFGGDRVSVNRRKEIVLT